MGISRGGEFGNDAPLVALSRSAAHLQHLAFGMTAATLALALFGISGRHYRLMMLSLPLAPGAYVSARECIRVNRSRSRLALEGKARERELDAAIRRNIEQMDWQWRQRHEDALEGERRRLEAEISALRDEVARLKGSEAKAKTEALEAARREREKFSQSLRDLEVEVAKLNADLTKEDEALEQLRQERDETIAQLEETSTANLTKAQARIQELEAAIANWEQRRTDIDRDLAAIQEWRIEQARNEGFIRQLESDRLSFESRIAQLEQASQAKISELSELIQQESESSFVAGFEECQSKVSPELERLRLERDRWRLRAERREARETFEESLPSLESVVSTERKPFLIVGSQGSGKALAAAFLAAAYDREGAGIIPVALDISEGDDPDSSWRKMGVPVTANPWLFLDLLEAVVGAMPGLPMRNNRAEFAASPCIIPIIDEALCAFQEFGKGEAERVIKALRALESRGAKRKIFPGILTQDNQIQNLKIGSQKLLNTGVLRNYYSLFLNDAFVSRCSDELLKRQRELGEYLGHMDGRFKAAIETYGKGGQIIKPIRHPSHHTNELSDTMPRDFSNFKIAQVPAWVPIGIKKIFAEQLGGEECGEECGEEPVASGAIAVADGEGLRAPSPPEAPHSGKVVAVSATEFSPSHQARTEFNDEAIARLEDAILKGLNQREAIESALGVKKSGRSKKWQSARDLFNHLKQRT